MYYSKHSLSRWMALFSLLLWGDFNLEQNMNKFSVQAFSPTYQYMYSNSHPHINNNNVHARSYTNLNRPTSRAFSNLNTHFSTAIKTKEEPAIGFETSCYIPQEEANALITLGKGTEKEKVINGQGMICLLTSLIVNPIWSLAMFITDAICKNNEDLDPNRAFYDRTGKIWAKAWLSMTNSYPTISGDVSRLSLEKEKEMGACLFVANHASWLDIPVLCTVLDPVFKFIAKGELAKVPCIGQQLIGVSV